MRMNVSDRHILAAGSAACLGVLFSFACGASTKIVAPPPPPPHGPGSVGIVSGAGQSVQVGFQLPQPLTVQVLDSSAKPLQGVPIAWNVVFGGGNLNVSLNNTDVAGKASTQFTVGGAAGMDSVKATVVGTGLHSVFGARAIALPPPDTTWPNQPAGFIVISDHHFDSFNSDGWSPNSNSGGNDSIVSDATAPRSPPHVGLANFPAGWTGGFDPIATQVSISGANYTRIYMSFWVKLSSNWIPHPSGVNKIGFVWIAGSPSVYESFQGSSFPLQPQIRLQGIPGGAVNLLPNVNNVPLNANTWYRWEIVLECNTGGNSDGVAHWWINGTETGLYTNIQYVASGSSHIWGSGGDGVSWRPVWGGIGDSVPGGQKMWVDDWYISGAP